MSDPSFDDATLAHDAPPIDSTWSEASADLRTTIERSLPGIRLASAVALAATGRLRLFRARDMLFRQGEAIPLTLMVRGYGGFRRTTAEGQQLTVGLAEPGQIYGITNASAVISTVDLVALTDGAAVQWRGDSFRGVIAGDPELALAVIDRLSIFLSILTGKVDGFLHQDARRRVIRVLARYRDLFFVDPPILSRAHLPGLVGTSRETGAASRRSPRPARRRCR